MPPVAMATASPRLIALDGTMPVWIASSPSAQTAWHLLGGAERVVRDDGEPVDVGSIERRDVHRGDDVGRENPTESGIEGDVLDAARRQIDGRSEAPLGLVAIEDLEELLLLSA